MASQWQSDTFTEGQHQNQRQCPTNSPRDGCHQGRVLPVQLYLPWQNHIPHWWDHGKLFFILFTECRSSEHDRSCHWSSLISGRFIGLFVGKTWAMLKIFFLKDVWWHKNIWHWLRLPSRAIPIFDSCFSQWQQTLTVINRVQCCNKAMKLSTAILTLV